MNSSFRISDFQNRLERVLFYLPVPTMRYIKIKGCGRIISGIRLEIVENMPQDEKKYPVKSSALFLA